MNLSSTAQKNTVCRFLTGFIRIKGVFNWLAISSFGFLLGTRSLDITSYLLSLCFFAVATFFILSFTFAINNYYDIDTDKENPRRAALNVLASGTISKHTGKLLILLFPIIPLVLSAFISWEALVFCGLLLLLMGMYSAPPVRLKSRPGIDILWHFIAFLALVLWGAYLAGGISPISIFAAASLGLYGCFAQLDNHIHDYAFDKASGSTTFAVSLGLRHAHNALILTFVLYIAFLLPLIILFPIQLYLTAVIIGVGITGSIGYIMIKKKTGAQRLFSIITIVGGSVYVNCLIYHLSSLL